jgi:hypothetical protein
MTEEGFNALWTNLVERSHKTDKPPLSQHERRFYAVNLLRGSVPRSGFIGYFENWRAADIAAAHEGLQALHLLPVLALLEKAQNAVLGDRALPNDSSPIAVFPNSLTEEEYERESNRIDAALDPIEKDFYKHDGEIWNALCEYADIHQLKPKG